MRLLAHLAVALGAMLAPLSAAAQKKLPVVATFSILGDMTVRVGGERVSVKTLVGPEGDAHVYQPTPTDAAEIAKARILIQNGLKFEGWLDKLIRASGYKGEMATASRGVTTIPASGGHGHAHNHDHGAVDPHAWQSLANALIYASNIRDGLCQVDGEGCAVYTANADAYQREISALDAEIKAKMAAVPASRRTVITSHDAFGYFARGYGIRFLAPRGVSTESEASAKDVARLIDQIRKEKATALFVENISDARLIEQIGRETGVKLGGTLYSDALSRPGGPAATYLEMMRHNAGLIAGAMAGS
jgi:zinc/manganese transport system substrate-binding protein